MKIELFVIAVTGFFIYNTLNDGIFIKNIFKYKKYFQIGFYCILGFSAYLLLKRDPLRLKKILLNSNDMIKYLPIDKNSMDIISPIIDFSNSNNSFMNGLNESIGDGGRGGGGGGGGGRGIGVLPTKRSVSETKKKYIASNQNWKCKSCGDMLTHTFEVDHVVRLQNGGSNDVSNLVAMCVNCHKNKTANENM